MPRRYAKPPRHGAPLADRVRVSHYAVERFRRRAPELAGDEPRARLAELIEREGAVLSKPPSWFQGELPPGGFLIGIQGRYVITSPETTRTYDSVVRDFAAFVVEQLGIAPTAAALCEDVLLDTSRIWRARRGPRRRAPWRRSSAPSRPRSPPQAPRRADRRRRL